MTYIRLHQTGHRQWINPEPFKRKPVTRLGQIRRRQMQERIAR